MEPQPGSPASPHSPGTSSSSSPNSAEVTAPSDEMPAPDEEATEVEQEPGRKSTSSSSSSDSSAESHHDVDVVDLGDTLVPSPEDEQAVAAPPEPSADGKPDGRAAPVEEQAAPPLVETAAGTKPDDDDQAAAPAVHGGEVTPDDRALPEEKHAAVHGAEVKPDDWATWPEEAPPPPVVDYSFSSDGSGGAGAVVPAGPAEAPQVQTMPAPEFDPQRIPASVFQPRTSVSQAEWSMTSNESLFSIQDASDVGGPPYAGSRSHFDFFYDEAMAAAEAESASKLPSVAEGTELGEPAAESREFKVPGSAGSQCSAAGSDDNAKKAAVYRRHDSGSGGSSSNFSFAFPILAPTSPKKKELASSALYQPLEKGWEPQQTPPPQMEPPRASAFVEMTTEAERRGSTEGCCCCGCCWFDCSWTRCCGWWRCCSCGCCSCPSFCRCSWCLCS